MIGGTGVVLPVPVVPIAEGGERSRCEVRRVRSCAEGGRPGADARVSDHARFSFAASRRTSAMLARGERNDEDVEYSGTVTGARITRPRDLPPAPVLEGALRGDSRR